MKYCIGCIHLNFRPRENPWGWTEETGTLGGEDAQFACSKGYWAEDIVDGTNLVDIQKAMERAESCGDFVERPAVSA